MLSAIGLPVCLSRAPRPTGPPALRPASKGHSSVKRLRKMSVKGSSSSHTLSSPAQLPPDLAAWTLFLALFGPSLSLHLLYLPCLPAEMATGILPSGHCWVMGLSLRTCVNLQCLLSMVSLLSLSGTSLTLNFDHLLPFPKHWLQACTTMPYSCSIKFETQRGLHAG